jgi:methionine biosynthesis protein MetW
MRDSAVKRLLVRGYFDAIEVKAALAGMVRAPSFGASIDYDAYWRHRSPGSVQPRFEVIRAVLTPGATVLDVGCGDGAMLAYFAETRQTRGVGIDISAEAVARAVARGVDARVQSPQDLLASGARFDHVVMSEVVEHVADAEGFVRRAWELTSGTLWLTFPNIAYFPHRLRLLSGKFPVQWVVFPGEHLRFWSAPDFIQWVVSLGLPRPRLTASNGLTAIGLHRLWPNLFANQIVARIDR